jgi:hypothetical protein
MELYNVMQVQNLAQNYLQNPQNTCTIVWHLSQCIYI